MSKASLELGGGNWAAKDGKLLGYAVGDTSGKYLPREFTFSRGADIAATRVNKDGLIEKYRENLLTYSNQFDTAPWTTGNATVTEGQAGYDGSNSAWKVDLTYSGGSVRQDVSSSGIVTASLYLKAGTLGFARLTLLASPNKFIDINLSTGAITEYGGIISSNSEDVGGGWFRVYFTSDATSVSRFYVYPIVAVNDFTATSGNIYIQDAQLEYGLVATDYLESGSTTGKAGVLDNLPRIDYTGGSASLLLEPSRTNLIPYSEYFGAASWSSFVFNGASLTLASGYEDPAGGNNAYKFALIVGTGGGLLTDEITVVTGVDYTLSVWMKGESGGEIVRLALKNKGSDGPSGDIITLTTEWTRYDVTLTADDVNRGFQFRLLYGDGASDQNIYVYGAQLEAGSYATSYIPTYGAQDTRAKDVSSITSVSSLIGSTEGTIYLEVAALANDLSDRRFALSDGTTNNVARVGFTDISNRIVAVLYNGTDQCELTYDGADITETNKIAFTYAANDFALYVNGESRSTDVSGVTFSAGTLSEIHFNEGDGSDNESYGKFDKVMIFPTRLSNTELAALTTL